MTRDVCSNSYAVLFVATVSFCPQGGASTALMMAVQRGNCEMINILLEHGADINAKNEVICLKDAVALDFGGFGYYQGPK